MVPKLVAARTPAPANGAVARFVEWRATRFAALLKRAGRTGNPAEMAAKSLERAARASAAAAPFALLGAVLVSPLALLAFLAPAVVLWIPELRLRDEVARRREGVERELPFFAIFVSVLGSAGVSLYAAMKELAEGEVFPSISKEALLVRRDVEIFGMNPNESFERLASNHPSMRFADFLTGYTSKARSGGDVAAYLSGEGGTLLRGLEGQWARYVARVGIVGSMMITVFGVLPLLLMVVGVFSPGFSIVGLVAFTGVGVPLFTVALVYLAGRMQPLREEGLEGKGLKSTLAAFPGLLVGAFTGQAWVAVAASLLIFFVVYGFSVREQLAERRDLDRGTSQFLKDLLEYKRQEYDLARAVVAIEANNGYNGRFDRLLARIASQLRAGVPLDEVKASSQSRMARLTFLLLGEMSRSGGGTVDTVYQVSNFADRMTEMRQNASAEMKPYVILSYISPLLLAFGVTFVGGVLSSFSDRLGSSLASLHSAGVGFGTIPPVLTEVSYLLIVVSAASLGIIGAKMTDLTVRNTLRASLCVVLAVAAIGVMGGLGSHSLVQLLLH